MAYGNKLSKQIRRAALKRSGGYCEARCSPECVMNAPTEFHHRKLRSAGGRGDLDNCLLLCAPCHRWVHEHPFLAYERGLMVSSYQNPAFVPVIPGLAEVVK